MSKRKVEDIASKGAKEEPIISVTPEEVPQPRKRGRPRKIRPPESDSAHDKGSQGSSNTSRKNTRQDVKKKISMPPPVHIVCDDATYYFGQDDESKLPEVFLDMSDAQDVQISNLLQQGACFTGSVATRFEELTRLEHHIAELLLQITVQSEYLLQLSEHSTEPQTPALPNELSAPITEEVSVHQRSTSESEAKPLSTEPFDVSDSPSTGVKNESHSPIASESNEASPTDESNQTATAQFESLQNEIKKRIQMSELELVRLIQEKSSIVNTMRMAAQEIHTESCNILNSMNATTEG
ncbi:hypothetical protein XU18_4646 [Perkinsela sp. CCAP 1560/4]|nr:hypothetical protein XU18_4646 [Perkinsela sp. CCAP 1560/4]|eukprot:KNH04078.1 hypothetical protein XU18_4646 [Perkinsela sp. CCAP 1560/4]